MNSSKDLGEQRHNHVRNEGCIIRCPTEQTFRQKRSEGTTWREATGGGQQNRQLSDGKQLKSTQLRSRDSEK